MMKKEKSGCVNCLEEAIKKAKENFPFEAKDDLAKGIKELIEAENHARYSYQVTGNKRWLEILKTLRKMRGKWSEILSREEEGFGKREETWCCSKHILSASKRLEEVADKLLDKDFDMRVVDELLKDGKLLYDIFFIINDPNFASKEDEKSD